MAEFDQRQRRKKRTAEDDDDDGLKSPDLEAKINELIVGDWQG